MLNRRSIVAAAAALSGLAASGAALAQGRTMRIVVSFPDISRSDHGAG